jgi:hypothetical protein
VSHLSSRLWGDPTHRFHEQQASARTIKEEEALAGDRRMAELNAMEARRLANLAAARQKQAAQQRVLLMATAAVVLVIVVAFVISLVVTGSR